MIGRFPSDVIPEDPVLVVWETGISDAVRGIEVEEFAAALQAGIDEIKHRAIDIMLVDMQFSRSTATVIDFDRYLTALHRVADLNEVYVFPRYEMMRYWSEQNMFNFDEVAADERARLAARVYDCIGRKLAHAIWQVGTNGVLRRDDVEIDEVLLRRGVALLQQSGTDIVLMDLQYAPRVVERPAYAEMEQLIAEIAHHTHVGLFRRFALMQYWQARHQPDMPPMIGADGLHMTDAGYGCLAAELAEALAANWSQSDRAQHTDGAAAQIAGLGRSGGSTRPEPDTH